jgi:restriction endonuclease Mrr
MWHEESSLISFLDFILSQDRVETFVRISRSSLLQSLKEYFLKSGISDDPELVFEDWEPLLRKSFFIKNHLIHYNVYTDTLTIEIVPTLQLMTRAAETYAINLKSLVTNALYNLTFEEFERLMKELFQRVPWIEKIDITQLSRDGGIDFEGIYRDTKSGLRMKLFGQAKHWNSKVGSETLRTFIGSMSVRSTSPSIGVFVATGGYTEDAKAAMQKSPIKILAYDVDSLARLVIDQEVGVKTFKIEGKIVDELFWKEIKE